MTKSHQCLELDDIRALRSQAGLPDDHGIAILDQAHACDDCLEICCCPPQKSEVWEPSTQMLVHCLRAFSGSGKWLRGAECLRRPYELLLEQCYNQVRFSSMSDPTAAFLRFDELLAMSSRMTPDDPAFEALQARRFAYLAERLLPFHPDQTREQLVRATELVQEETAEAFLWTLFRRIFITVIYHDRPELAARKFAGLLAEVPGIFHEYELHLDIARFLFEAEAPPDLILEQVNWLGATPASGLEDAESLYLMSLVGDPLYRLAPEKWGRYSNQVRPMRIRFAPPEQRRAFAKEWSRVKNRVGRESFEFDRDQYADEDAARTAAWLRWMLGEEAELSGNPDPEKETSP